MLRLLQKTSFFYISKFEQAVQVMKKTGKYANLQQKENQQLQLYALYMQATSGDAKYGSKGDSAELPKTSETMEEINKFEAWDKYKGLTKQKA